MTSPSNFDKLLAPSLEHAVDRGLATFSQFLGLKELEFCDWLKAVFTAHRNLSKSEAKKIGGFVKNRGWHKAKDVLVDTIMNYSRRDVQPALDECSSLWDRLKPSRIFSVAKEASAQPKTDALIVTALPLEERAVIAHLSDLRDHVGSNDTRYSVGTFSSRNRTWAIAVACAGSGNVASALNTFSGVGEFRPEVILFVGIAGGLKDVSLGDVVAGDKIYYYESGRDEDEFKPRAKFGMPSHALSEAAKAVIKKASWVARIKNPTSMAPEPTALLGAIAAGENVVGSTKSQTFQLIRKLYSDALAVEMEAYGFHAALKEANLSQGLVIRGISDLIDNKGVSDTAGFQDVAADHAAAFAYEVLSEYVVNVQ
jgi:nucleoside phosphorylase